MFRKGSSTLDAIAPASARSSTMSDLARKAAETVFDLTGVIQDSGARHKRQLSAANGTTCADLPRNGAPCTIVSSRVLFS